MRLAGLIFDMGDILFDATAWRRWLAGELGRRGLAVTYEQLVGRWEAALVDVYRGQVKYWDRLAEMLASFGLGESAAAELVRAAREKGHQVRAERKLFDGVAATLEALKKAGVKLAVLSDSESGQDQLRELLAKLGIEHCFDAVVTSVDIAAVKPEPRAFQAAADALGLELSQCAFVGHDIDELSGAQAAGLYAIAYNYPLGAPADRYVEHFEQLLEVVAGSR